jgi:hypothetical protein
MSSPFEQTPQFVDPWSPALGQRCPGCGELFKEGDATLWVTHDRRGPPRGPEAVTVHARCVQPRDIVTTPPE